MILYILIAYKYEDYWVVGLYDSREKAVEVYKEHKHKEYGFYLHKIEVNAPTPFVDPYNDDSCDGGEWLNRS